MSIKKTSKYNNVFTTYNGKKYHSRSEAHYAEILDGLLAEGKIKEIREQVRYPLRDMNGTMRMSYVADFVVTSATGVEYIIDVKGMLTAGNKVKIAYFLYVYKKDLWLVATTGLDKFRTDFIV